MEGKRSCSVRGRAKEQPGGFAGEDTAAKPNNNHKPQPMGRKQSQNKKG